MPSHANSAPAEIPCSLPGLAAFWTFGEEAGQARLSHGTSEPHPLREAGEPVERVVGGPYSGYSARFDGHNYLRIPHRELGDLDIGGPGAQVSMFAAVCMDDLIGGATVAGVWNEGQGAHDDTGTRQYAMLLNMPTYGGARQLTPHVSAEGGVTRRADGSSFPWCADYAASVSEVPVGRWVTLGFTYDGMWLRAYFNGVLEPRGIVGKEDRRDDPYFLREGPGGGPRGINPYYHGRGICRYDPVIHARTKPDGGSDFTVAARFAVGDIFSEPTRGRFGGLAVYRRALSDDEMARLHASAGIECLT